MRTLRAPWLWSGLALLVLSGCLPDTTPEEQPAEETGPAPTPDVVMETSRGDIVIELFDEEAPLTVANFLLHVRSHFYDNLIFHRVRPAFVQAGLATEDMRERIGGTPPVHNEAPNGLKNTRGTLAMAHTDDPHSARSQFFINVTDNPQFDFTDSTTAGGWGYAVFGTVTEGMGIVDAIARGRTQARGRHQNVPVEPVVITRAYIAPRDADPPPEP